MSADTQAAFSDTDIAALPTPLAIAIAEYRREPRNERGEPMHLLTLWQASETVELLLRLLVSVAIGELHGHDRLAGELAARLRDRIERPTLGHWKSMLLDLAGALMPERTVLAELPGMADGIRGFFGGGAQADVLTSFTALRNRLAHGAGLTHVAAEMLLAEWRERIDAFLGGFLWLSELAFHARAPDGTPVLLRGPRAQRLDAAVPGAAGGAAGGAYVDAVVALRGGLSTVVWPLLRYGIPWIPGRNMLARDTVVEMYARRSGFEGFHYTPIGLDVAHWSQSRAEATARFQQMFPPVREGGEGGGRDAAESFRAEIAREAKLCVGRQAELNRVLEKIRHPAARSPAGTSLLWLSGGAGIGKSTLVARLVERLGEDGGGARLVPYRFRRGDARCSREYFFMLASRSLAGTARAEDPASYDIGALRGALRGALQALPAASGCVFVLDGMDEIDELDPGFVTEVCLKLAHEFAGGQVTWLCAGREASGHSSLQQKFLEAGADPIFPAGLAPMQDKDIRAILLEQTGTARNALILKDETTPAELFRLPWSAALAAALDADTVPGALVAAFAAQGRRLDPASRCHAMRRGRSTAWVIDDDDDNEMYYAERVGDALRVCADRVESEFVNRVAEMSEGLPLYVRFVVHDILAGRWRDLDGREDLPQGLAGYYRQLLEGYGVRTELTLRTQVLCLLAVAKEPLSKEQLTLRLCCPHQPLLPRSEDPEQWFERVMAYLSPMLRGGRRGADGSGYTLYHHSLRQHLEQDPETRPSVELEREWLTHRECATLPLENAGPYADYVARHGVAHLLEAGRIAEAVNLLDHLKARPDRQVYFPRGYLAVTTKQVGLALQHWLEAWTGELTDEARRAREAAARAVVPAALANVIGDTYETGMYSAALRILIEFHPDAWWANRDDIKDRFLTPYDIVAKHSIGEALAETWLAAAAPDRADLLARIKAMALGPDIEEREAAGYALQGIYLEAPERIDGEVIARWADSETNTERMLLGELLVSFAHAGATDFARRIGAERFWHPAWDYHAIDIEDFDVLAGHVPGHLDAARLAASARAHAATRALLARLLAEPAVRGDARLLELLAAYDELGAGDARVRRAVPALQAALEGRETRAVARDLIRVLFSHPLWTVAEAGTSALAMIVEEDVRHLALIRELLAEPDAYWRVRYGTVDAAFNVRELDGGQLFRQAIRDNFAHANARVRGICCDDFFAWVRLADAAEREAIMGEFEPQLRHAVEHASDCWELEYLYLLFRFLHGAGFDVPAWLAGNRGLARYLGGEDDTPFYQLGREDFLLRIDRIREAELHRPLQGIPA